MTDIIFYAQIEYGYITMNMKRSSISPYNSIKEDYYINNIGVTAMNLKMIGIDFTSAAITVRQRFSFTKTKQLLLLEALKSSPHVLGAALLATAHGTGVEDLQRRPVYRALLDYQIFRRLVVIERRTGGRAARVEVLV